MFRSSRPHSYLLLVFLTCFVAVCPAAATADLSCARSSQRSLASRERSAFQPAIQKARFSDIPHAMVPNRCSNAHPPEALATPSPYLPTAELNDRVIVSFIVGTDGRVHSALVLAGGDDQDDQLVLNVVRHWRYRPATCNGVPTESEAKVEFSRPPR